MDLLTATAASMLRSSRSRVSAVFKELRQRQPTCSLEAVLERREVRASTRGAERARADAAAALEAGATLGMTLIPWYDERYPALLACIPDPPPVLWCQGMTSALTRPAVAIVGSRA